MKHFLICVGIFLNLFTFGHAQSADQARKSDEVVAKMRQIDLLVQIIPLALTKDQLDKLLPAVERARAKVRQIEKEEADTLAKLDSKVTDAVNKAIETSVAPPKALLDELASATQTMADKRQTAIEDNTDLVIKVFNDVCNAGQKAAAANSLAPQMFDPNLKPDKMTQAEKIRFFIQQILLDPQAYDVMLRLEKHTSG